MRIIKSAVAKSLKRLGYEVRRTTGTNQTVAELHVPAAKTPAAPKPRLSSLEKEFGFISGLPGFLDVNAYGLFCQLGAHAPVNSPAILEIGIFCGKSYLALGMAFKKPKTVVGVDPFFEDFKDSPVLENEGEYLEEASDHLSRDERIGLLHKVLKQSDRFRPNLPKKFDVRELTQDDFFRTKKSTEKFDVAHIDGEHTFKAVYDFFDEAAATLNKNALVIVDDFLNPGFPGISEAVHTHPAYKQLTPVFYGFNKAVFVYKADRNVASRLVDNLTRHYRTSTHTVRPLEDGSVMVQ